MSRTVTVTLAPLDGEACSDRELLDRVVHTNVCRWRRDFGALLLHDSDGVEVCYARGTWLTYAITDEPPSPRVVGQVRPSPSDMPARRSR